MHGIDPALPIHPLLPQIAASLAAHPACVLQAAPGAGKTTQVPLALLDQPWLANKKILMLEPRRLAARAAAQRMATLIGEESGQTVGYRIRFEQKVSARTRIEVLTEGILTRRLQSDPELGDVGLVIFDEFHERHLHSDLALALTLDIQQALRPDLKVLIMSATLDVAPLTKLLNAPLLQSEGRSFPVAIDYLKQEPKGDIAVVAAHAAVDALARYEGDVLMFMPGTGEIRSAMRYLSERVDAAVRVLPLYGDLAPAAQQAALESEPGIRKVIVATPIAETSLTIPGVRIVIDSGFMRRPRFDPNSGLTHLETVRLSQASATQRAGRAGRTAPGVCMRLWTETTQRGLVPHIAPEIVTADLAPLLLELSLWGAEPEALRWLDPPPPAHCAQAGSLLRDLGALDDDGHITRRGKAMAALPLHPRLARMMLSGQASNQAALAADVAALISERDLLRGSSRRGADLAVRWQVLNAYRGAAHGVDIDRSACAQVERAAEQYRRLLSNAKAAGADSDAIGALLAQAYPDRIAMQRAPNSRRYLLRNGRGAQLPERDALMSSPFLVAAHIDGGSGAEATIHLGATIDVAELRRDFADEIVAEEAVRWDDSAAGVVAQLEERLGVLVLSRKPLLPAATAERAVSAMMHGIQRLGSVCLPWDRETREWQARVLSLRAWLPNESWPDVGDTALFADLSWLAPHLPGITRREQLAQLDLTSILNGMLDWQQRARVDVAAPTHIAVPSGSRIRLQYRIGQAPVLAVKLQELFGLADTPRVADGKIPVVLHLLSPAQRPIQVTQDLRGFWDRTYAEVKKELKGRYPKHPWPDDPWNATPTARRRPKT